MRLSTLFLITLLLGGLWLLAQRFPYISLSSDDKAHAAYAVLLLALMAGGLATRYRGRGSEMLRHLLSWSVIIVAIITSYGYRDVLLNSPFISSLVPQRAIVSGDGTVAFRAASDGHFYVEATINGTLVQFMVDTGASDITLSAKDAERIGFRLDALTFSRTYHTANGVISGAPVSLESFTVGPILLQNIQASVNKADMNTSLLGMEFFQQLRGFSVQGDVLTLQP